MSPEAAWILQEEVALRLKATIPFTVRQISSEDGEELLLDSICFATHLMENAERANKKVTPGNTSYFTQLHMRSGRRSYGSSMADALGIGFQLNGRSTTTSLDEPPGRILSTSSGLNALVCERLVSKVNECVPEDDAGQAQAVIKRVAANGSEAVAHCD